MPLYGLLIFFGTPYSQIVTTPSQCYLLLASVLFFTILIPLGFMLVRIWRGKASSLMLPDRRERRLPYLVAFLSYVALENLLALSGMDPALC